jgi:trans-aconitate methyltransferase
MPTVPHRIRWAVDLLDIHPDHRILEIGCGPGVAAGLVTERLTTGHLVAIDRSATAVRRATARTPLTSTPAGSPSPPPTSPAITTMARRST